MKHFPIFLISSLVLAVAIFLAPASCTPSRPPGKLTVACSNAVLADFVRTVGGAHVDVRTLAKPLDDAHMLVSTPDLVRAVGESWAVFENGLGLEPWLDDIVKAAPGDQKRFLATKGVTPLMRGDGSPDPHAWLDPRRAITYVENAQNMLIELDPDHETEFRTNTDALIDGIKGLEAYIISESEGIPPPRRRLLVVHDSLRYFAARFRYETTALAPAGVAPTTDMESAANDWLGKERTPSMFCEAGREETAMRALSFKNGRRVVGPLWTDTLDAPGKPAGSYIPAMKENMEMMVKGLR